MANGRRSKLTGPMLVIELTLPEARIAKVERKGNSIATLQFVRTVLKLEESAHADAAAVGAEIAKALEVANIKPLPTIISVPRRQLVLRTMSLPKMQDLAELATLVHFQTARDLPFRMDEAVIDFMPMASAAEQAKTTVMVAAARRDLVEFYQKMAQSAGLKLAALGLQPYANARCVKASVDHASPEEGIALLSLDKAEAVVDVILGDDVLFSRNARFGDPDVESAAAIQEGATIEILRTLHGYGGSEGAVKLEQLLVTGSTGSEDQIAQNLSQRLGRPCARLDISKAVGGDYNPEDAPSAAIIGLALSATDSAGLPFDFLNAKRPAPPKNTRRNVIIAAATAGVVLLIGVIATRTILIRQRQAEQKTLATQLAGMEKDRVIFRRMVQQAQVIEGWDKGARDWLAHYAYLSAVLPPSEELYITSFAVTPTGAMRLAVQAKSGEVLAATERQLRAAGYEVKPVAVTPANDRFGYDFRSSIELITPKSFKMDLSKVKAPARPVDDASLDPAVYKKGAG